MEVKVGTGRPSSLRKTSMKPPVSPSTKLVAFGDEGHVFAVRAHRGIYAVFVALDRLPGAVEQRTMAPVCEVLTEDVTRQVGVARDQVYRRRSGRPRTCRPR